MKNKLLAFALLIISVNRVSSQTLFEDSFDGTSINTLKWTVQGVHIKQNEDVMKLEQNVTDQATNLISKDINFVSSSLIKISRKVLVNYNNNYYYGSMNLKFNGNDKSVIQVSYQNSAYYNGGYQPLRMGIYLNCNGKETLMQGSVLWNQWFDETLFYNPSTGEVTYLINNKTIGKYQTGFKLSGNNMMQISFSPYGWWTGHKHYFDNFKVEYATTDNANQPISNNNSYNNTVMSPQDKINPISTDLAFAFNKELSHLPYPSYEGTEKEIKKAIKNGEQGMRLKYGVGLLKGNYDYSPDKIQEGIKMLREAMLENEIEAKYWFYWFYLQDMNLYDLKPEALKYLNQLVDKKYAPAILDKSIMLLTGLENHQIDCLEAKRILQTIPENKNAVIELSKIQLMGESLSSDNPTEAEIAISNLQKNGETKLIDSWQEKFKHFGHFRYAKTKQPTLLRSINTTINYKNENEVKKLIEEISANSEILGSNLVKKFTYELLDNLDVINNTISADYENDYFKMVSNTGKIDLLKSFLKKFPKSEKLPEIKQQLALQDDYVYNNCNVKSCFVDYLSTFPNGKNVQKAKDKIAAFKLEEAKLEKAKLEEEERLKLAKLEEEKKKKEAKEQLIKEKGADYVVSENCIEKYGWFWGDYERCDLVFADGTTSIGKLIYVDGYYGFEGRTTIAGDEKILYETFDYATKDAYRIAKGMPRSDMGRYYPPTKTYSSNDVSSSDFDIISSSNAKISISSDDGLFGIIDNDYSCNASSEVNYSCVIYDNEGNEIKRFDNHYDLISTAGNDADNIYYVSQYDYPITVSVSYKVCCNFCSKAGEYVSATVKVYKPIQLNIIPD